MLKLSNASKKFDEVLKKLSEQEAVNKKIAKENEFLKSTVKALDSRVRKLQSTRNDMEQCSRRECVKIQVIPVSEQEDTNKIVMKMGELMGIEIKKDAISVSHRPVMPINNKDDLKTEAISKMSKITVIL